jgi:lysophospholipase L1-like esterase
MRLKLSGKIILALSLCGNLAIVYVGLKALEYRRHINEFLEKYTYVVSEFSGRKNYQAENKAMASASQVMNRVVFIGTQVTCEWDVKKYFPGFQVINRGISGQRLAGFLLRFKPDVLDLFPRVVVIEFSSYNFRPENRIDELEDYIESLGDLARFHGITPIFTTVIPVRRDFYVDDIGSYSVPDSLNSYNNWLRNYCQENGYYCADFYRILSDSSGNLPQELSTSQIQLNSAGYEKISKEILNNIENIIQDGHSK